MARKNNLKMTPLMSLSMFAIFALMIPLFSLANRAESAKVSRASELPTPEPTADSMYQLEK